MIKPIDRKTRMIGIMLGGCLVLVGIPLLVSTRFSPPPTFESLDHRTGVLTAWTLRMLSHPATIILVVDGNRLAMIGDDERLLAMNSMLHLRDTLDIWTSKSAVGPPGIWQVARRGHYVVRYEERRQRAIHLNDFTPVIAGSVVVLGIGGIIAALLWPATEPLAETM